MFFSKINQWSQRKLRVIYILSTITLLVLQLAAPLIIICINYNLFKHTTEGNVINGLGLILILIFSILGLRSFKRIVEKMEDITHKEQLLKYFLLMLYAISIPLICVIVLLAFKENFKLAYKTFCISLIFYTIGIFFDYMFMKFIEREKDFRHKAKERIEVELRMNVLKK